VVEKNKALVVLSEVQGLCCYFSGKCFGLKMKLCFDSDGRVISDPVEATEFLNQKYGIPAYMEGGSLCLRSEDIPNGIEGVTIEHLEWPDAMP